MKTSLILTVLNEEKHILEFLKSLKNQSVNPSEVIIVDGGSTDKTLSKILNFKEKNKLKFELYILEIKGNISKGRNTAIKSAKNKIILCTDAGCELDKDWVKNISSPFENSKIDVVSGFYKPTGKTIFQKCLATYTSVMPDKLNEEEYLPSSRSIAFKKSAWEKVGGYPQWLDRGEDLYFAKKLKEKKLFFKFQGNAIVFWEQSRNIVQAFKQFYGYAKGDATAGNIRNEVLLVYLRYIIGFYLVFISILERSKTGLLFTIFLLILYVLWSIKKNYKYIKSLKAVIILPILQFTADLAILTGTIAGLLRKISLKKSKNLFSQNKFIFFILGIYFLILLLTIHWGAPSSINPYPYNMDEWHQFQAVRTTVAYGTPNMAGSANGTMFHFLLSAFFLVPFTLIGYIDPVNLPVNDLAMREKIFELLRLNTIIYGSLSIVTLYSIAKKIKVSPVLAISLFVFTPIWMNLSGFFKYDIALIFWILLSFLFLINFIKKPTDRNFIISAIPIAIAFSVKVSAIPLLPIYFVSFFWFYKNSLKNIKIFLFGIGIFVVLALLLGIPDTLFGKGNILLFLKENLIGFPSSASTLDLGMSTRLYLYLKQYPIIFGHGLYILFIISIIFLIFFYAKSGIKYSLKYFNIDLFLIFSFSMFFLSLYSLDLFAGGNKSLVYLPLAVLIIGVAFERIKKFNLIKKGYLLLIIVVLLINISEALLWANLRMHDSPQVITSNWILKNIPKNSEIGLENVPIYQNIPDFLKKEYYFMTDGYGRNNLYKYSIIDANSQEIPKVVVLIDGEIDSKVNKISVKKNLIARLENEGYSRIYILHSKKPYKMSDIEYSFSWINSNPVTIDIYIKK